MPDITMCDGSNCPLSDECYRHTATPDSYSQSWFIKVPYSKKTKSCDSFWRE